MFTQAPYKFTEEPEMTEFMALVAMIILMAKMEMTVYPVSQVTTL